MLEFYFRFDCNVQSTFNFLKWKKSVPSNSSLSKELIVTLYQIILKSQKQFCNWFFSNNDKDFTWPGTKSWNSCTPLGLILQKNYCTYCINFHTTIIHNTIKWKFVGPTYVTLLTHPMNLLTLHVDGYQWALFEEAFNS